MLCDFVSTLSQLKTSSLSSVDDQDSFDNNSTKKYLHVERTIDAELREVISKVNGSHKKTLILLCGNAGDGKSHLLSYFNSEHMLDGFCVRNDGAESDRKDHTAVQTLSTYLHEFSDIELNEPGQNTILAINLGVLSNFIKAEGKANFTKLAWFVEEHCILSGQICQDGYDPESNFQYISFGDYNLFSLTKNGIDSTYIETLISRICNQSQDNPFYQAYCKKTNSCPNCTHCPVRHNYEFLSNKIVQHNIAQLLCETIIKNKSVISTREIIDYVYAIIVHHEFDYNSICQTSNSQYELTYMKYSLPILMFEYEERSPILQEVAQYDALRERAEVIDDFAIQFNAAASVKPFVEQGLAETPYMVLLNNQNLFDHINADMSMKALVFRMLERMKDLKSAKEVSKDSVYNNFVTDLYYFNKGRIANLEGLYEIVQDAIFKWNGKYSDDYICLNNQYDSISVFEELSIEPDLNMTQEVNEEVLQRFGLNLVASFSNNQNPTKTVSLRIDYSLYKLLSAVRSGYHPSAEDKNKHADFVAFIDELKSIGNYQREVVFIDRNGSGSNIAIFRKTAFGHEFKVI